MTKMGDDEQIDLVLRALAQPEPAPGLQARMEDGIRARMQASELRRRSRWIRVPLALGAAAAIAGGFYFEGARRWIEPTTVPQAPYMVRSGGGAIGPVAASPPAEAVKKGGRRRLQTASASYAQPLKSGLGLVNRPAPPEPLTAQERILRRVAEDRAPHELLAMTAGAEQERSREWQQQYQEFFAPAFRSAAEIEAAWKRTAPEVMAPAQTAAGPGQTQSR